MDDRVWVICISHDYGVWGEAGYFFTEEDADKWIAQKIEKDKVRHAEYIADWDEEYHEGPPADDDKEFCPTEFYAAELKQGSV
jgi:hypothetical protein